jgi:hypothetical protein
VLSISKQIVPQIPTATATSHLPLSHSPATTTYHYHYSATATQQPQLLAAAGDWRPWRGRCCCYWQPGAGLLGFSSSDADRARRSAFGFGPLALAIGKLQTLALASIGFGLLIWHLVIWHFLALAPPAKEKEQIALGRCCGRGAGAAWLYVAGQCPPRGRGGGGGGGPHPVAGARVSWPGSGLGWIRQACWGEKPRLVLVLVWHLYGCVTTSAQHVRLRWQPWQLDKPRWPCAPTSPTPPSTSAKNQQ